MPHWGKGFRYGTFLAFVIIFRDNGPRRRLPTARRIADYSAFKKRAANGGKVRFSEKGRPWTGTSSAVTPPALPMPLPPYSLASLFRSSRQYPPEGTPRR